MIESGTHDDLVQNPESAYRLLVNAQALREQQEQEPRPAALTESTPAGAETKEKMQWTGPADLNSKSNATDAWIPLTRPSTVGSQSIDAKAAKELDPSPSKDDDTHDDNMMYLVKRMGNINRPNLAVYALGTAGAIGTHLENSNSSTCL